MKILKNRECEVTIKRINGNIETMIHPNFDFMTEEVVKRSNELMLKANRGQIISYKNIDAVVEMEDSDYIVGCVRCGEKLDTRKAYSQIGWHKANKVIDHYCDGCKKLLSAIGSGEQTELENRSAEKEGIELTTKED